MDDRVVGGLSVSGGENRSDDARGAGWWKEAPYWWKLPEREEIMRREKAEVERLVGGYPKKQDASIWRTKKLDFLGSERREAVPRLQKDYEEMRDKLPPTPWLPHEAEMHRKLVEEERRDLVALLAPEELAEYDFREDAELLGRALDRYNVTDAELRALYRAREDMAARLRQLETKYPGYHEDPFAPVTNQDPRAVAEEKFFREGYEKRMLEIFGAERMARGDRESDPAFDRIQEVTTKFSLEKRQAETVYDLPKRARDEASELAVERNEQGEARLAALRQDMLEQLNEALPPGGAGLLLDQVMTYHHWLREPASVR